MIFLPDNNIKIMRKIVICLIFTILFCTSVKAQSLDFYIGGDLFIRDLVYEKIYEATVNLTPGVKWRMKDDWTISAEANIPLHSDFGDDYKLPRLNMATITKLWQINYKTYLKLSGGLFNLGRYGIDAKWLYKLNSIIHFEGEIGYTDYYSTLYKISDINKPIDRLMAIVGVNAYLKEHRTLLRVRAGRFIHQDLGAIADCIRHFTHCSVGVYLQYSELRSKPSAGFTITVMLPPYNRKEKRVNFRTKSNFQLTYNVNSNYNLTETYKTDPEENDRDGWFNEVTSI